MSMERKTVYVGMSGGVDSSVAAALLQERGFRVVGVHLLCWNEEGAECRADEDRADAERVAAQLEIPFEVWDLTTEYKKRVYDYMVAEYQQGRTPNPDVMCNREIKFGLFMEEALRRGADYVATGHYARLEEKDGEIYLAEAKDKEKDQSYFLWTLLNKDLSKVIFPLGDYTKPEVRQMAKKFNLPTASKPDSQGLCFVGKVDFQKFLEREMKVQPGEVKNRVGQKVGEHRGVDFYTLGQRRGVGSFGGGQAYYVVGKDRKTNTLTVSDKKEDGRVEGVEVEGFINKGEKTEEREVRVRIRYRQPLVEAILRQSEEGVKIDFKTEVYFAAEGQSVVCYDRNGLIIGAGVIKSAY